MSWQSRAACRGLTELFFPKDNAAGAPAIAICEACEVRQDCLYDALRAGEQDGIRGGYRAEEREQMRGHLPRRLWCGYCAMPFEAIVQRGKPPKHCSARCAREFRLESLRRSRQKQQMSA